MKLTGQVVVVTGAARGIGATLAQELARRGALVALLGLEPDVLAATAAAIPGARAYDVDVCDSAALKEVAGRVVADFGRVDVVVANAGIAASGPLLLADEASWDKTVEVNLLGSVRTIRAFLPALIASQGYVLQISSLSALTPAPFMTAYTASKAGVEAFAHALRAELKHHRVRVGVGYLAFTDTDLVRGVDSKAGLSTMRAGLQGPFGKTYPLAPAVVRLAEGIERRSPHVYAQKWLRVMQYVRGAVPSVITVGARGLKEAEAEIVAAGAESVTRPVGAGGEANSLQKG